MPCFLRAHSHLRRFAIFQPVLEAAPLIQPFKISLASNGSCNDSHITSKGRR